MEHVFVDEEKGDLKSDVLPSRERHLPGAHSEALGNWVKQPNLGQGVRGRSTRAEPRTYQGKLYGEVGKENSLCALPLVLSGGDLVRLELPPAKVRDRVDNDPRDTTSKIDNLPGLCE